MVCGSRSESNTMRRSMYIITTLLMGTMILASPGLVSGQGASTPASGTPAAEAGAQVQIVLRPDGGSDSERMEVDIDAGQTRDLALYIGNMGLESLTVFTFTADISTRVNGGLNMGDEGSEQHEPTTWIEYPTEEYVIDPGMEVRRDFQLTVPEGVAPGEYVIPIAVETLDSFEIPGTSQIRQKVRKIMAVYVIVAGEKASGFEFGDPFAEYLDPRTLALQVPMTNTGNTTLRLQGQVTVTDQSGGVLIDREMPLGAFYRGDETLLRLPLPPGLPEGEYFLTLSFADSLSGVSGGFEGRGFVVPEAPDGAVEPYGFENASVAANADPIQFANVAVDVANNVDVLRNGRLMLVVEKDGQALEEFPLAENLTLNQGTTTISQRYLPVTGWESGQYSFSLRLESVDSETGMVQVLLTQDDVATIEVP